MENINKIIKTNNIDLVFLQFCDLSGTIKGIYIPPSQLSLAIKNGISFDSSSIKCYGKTKNSDKKCTIDTSKYFILPNNILTFFCFLNTKYDARKNLKKLENKLLKQYYKMQMGAELEFYLFERKNNEADLNKLEKVNYFSEINLKKLNALKEIVSILNNQNFKVEAVHHECGKNQYELTFKFDTLLNTCDKIIIAKQVIKQIAKKHNLYASFMPKPISYLAGSGMHINLSCSKNGENIFYDENNKMGLSNFANQLTFNISKHIGAICAFSNPIINSYKRLNAGMETPTKVYMGLKDRQSAFRIPAITKNSARIECRFPDVFCQPYLTTLAIHLSAFENLFQKQTNSNIVPIKMLPKSLSESLEYLKNDNLLNRLVPKAHIKEQQKIIEKYEKQITNFELKNYL